MFYLLTFMLPVDFFKIAGHLIEIVLNDSHILVKL